MNIKEKYDTALKDYKYCKGHSIRKEKLGGYIKYTTKTGIMKGYGVYIKNYDSHILLKNPNANKLWKVSLDDNYIFYKSHVSISDVKRRVMIELLKRFQ